MGLLVIQTGAPIAPAVLGFQILPLCSETIFWFDYFTGVRGSRFVQYSPGSTDISYHS